MNILKNIDGSTIYVSDGVPFGSKDGEGRRIPNESICVDSFNKFIYKLVNKNWTLQTTDSTLNLTNSIFEANNTNVENWYGINLINVNDGVKYITTYNGSTTLNYVLPNAKDNIAKFIVIEDSLGLGICILNSDRGSTLYGFGGLGNGQVSTMYLYSDGDAWNIATIYLPLVSPGGGIEGTQYIFVSANGTDTENATELQAAYDLAKTKKQVNNTWVSLPSGGFFVSVSQIFSFLNTNTTIPWVGGQTYTIRLDGVEYTGVNQNSNTYLVQMTSVTAPYGFYTTMEVLVQEIVPSRVIIAPGYYNFASDFLVDEEYVDIVSLDGNRSVIFNGSGTINVTANNIFIKGIDVQNKNFTIATNLDGLNVENCKGGSYSFGGDDTSISPITVSGTFTNCEGGNFSFGAYGVASGTFINCLAKSGFGIFYPSGVASGTFINCRTINEGFGGQNALASGYFENCEAGGASYGAGSLGVASGTFINCKGGGASFGGFGVASGTFTNCSATEQSFGGYGGNGGTASGVFNNCIGDVGSFAGNGTLSGKLYYCRLTSGTFQTVSGSGRTYYCVDGDGNVNNQ
jgi:hypothetical protein